MPVWKATKRQRVLILTPRACACSAAMFYYVGSASLALVMVGWTSFFSGQLLYLRWKTRVIGLCSGLTTLTIMVPSAARV